MAIERTTFNGIVVGPYTYPAIRKPDGLYVKTMCRQKPAPALRFLLEALSAGDVDVLFDGEHIPIKRSNETGTRAPFKVVMYALATDHERLLLSHVDVSSPTLGIDDE